MAKSSKKPASGLVGSLRSFVLDPKFPVVATMIAFLLYLVNTFLSKNNILQVPLGLFAVFFAPGYLWLDVLSARNRLTELSERAITSIALSIGLVILSVTFSSLVLKLPLRQDTVSLVLALICAAGLGARKVFLKKYF